MARKRGKLSKDEEKFIRDNIERLDIHQIAIQINRTDGVVDKYAAKNNLTYKGISEQKLDDNVLLRMLEERPYYSQIHDQLTKDEVHYFRVTWVRIFTQFQEDVFYTEELQIKQWIILEILSNRCMRDRKYHIEQVDRLQKLLDKAYEAHPETRDSERIAVMESEISMMRNSVSSYMSEHAKILEKIQAIQKDLKATRDQRIKRIEDSQSSFKGLLTALEDMEVRKRVGEDAEIGRIAMKASKVKLGRLHEYEDGKIDQPFLTPESVRQVQDSEATDAS